MRASYQVRIWSIKERKSTTGKVVSYGVRWKVETRAFYRTFKVKAQADSFRADLLSVQRRGEGFDTTTGLPQSLERSDVNMNWYELTCRYLDTRWPDLSPTARRTVAEALIRLAPVFIKDGKSAPDAKTIRSALGQWGYNTALRDRADVPVWARDVLRWCERNMAAVKTVCEASTLRALKRAVTRQLNGQPYAPTVARKTRSVLWNLLEYAREQKVIDVNPLTDTPWKDMPKGRRKVDRRAVPNPIQARTILGEVERQGDSGKICYAFFGAMYFSALRPEEAVALNKRNLALPEPHWNPRTEQHEYDWGAFHLDEAWPHAGKRWTDQRKQPRDKRQLKSRAAGEGRTVPCPPELTAILLRHIEAHGYGDDGSVFRGVKGGQLPLITYTRVWRAARRAALTEDAHASPLAKRPYDLRHAAVSTWLAGGVDPARVADWAGHSISVLYEIYAAFLDGGDAAARQQVQAALGH